MHFRGSTLPAFTALFLFACGGDDGDETADTGGATEATGTTAVADDDGMTMTGTPGTGTTPPAETSDGDDTTGDDTTGDAESTGMPADTSTGAAGCSGTTFFATSVGSGKLGGNLGGLAGADATCQMLANAVGQGGCTWHAYLSTADEDARDRIGAGPWVNAAGEEIAADVESLHGDGLSNGDPQHVLDENGDEVPVDEHDILTGSQEDGTLLQGATCADWTSDSGQDQARVGHSDIPGNPKFSPSWNSAHDTPGCSAKALEQVGGAGRLYCFAID